MSARDELALILVNAQRARYSLPPRTTTAYCSESCWAEADAILAAGYVKADHTEYALDHKRSDLQFTDDAGELWTDEDDVKDYADEYGDTAPLVQRHVTAWEPVK